jgi:hypothetical protein
MGASSRTGRAAKANLYHWLVGDTHFYKGNTGRPMPLKGYRYFNNDDQE